MGSNPKMIRARADNKSPLEYIMWNLLASEARVLQGGADKYGIRNWRKTAILASTYEGAMLRHLSAWAMGEDIDPDSGEPHLQHLRASCAVVLDADEHNTLIDDRDRVESIDHEMPGKFDHCPDSTTFNDFPKPTMTFIEPHKAPIFRTPMQGKEGCLYAVEFRSEANANGLVYTSFEGPFTTQKLAVDHAIENPNNITGIRSIHAINKP